jgi:trans-aconitate methyltransferase
VIETEGKCMKKLFLFLFILSTIAYGMDDGRKNNNQQWDGQYYKTNSSHQVQGALLTLGDLPVENYPSILDIGCGSGEVTAAIAERAPKSYIVGIDNSQSMIAEAKKTYKIIDNVIFEHADAEKLTFHNEFDLVVSFAALHWMRNQSAVFDGMNRSLKPGGKICFHMVADATETENPLLQAFKTAAKKDRWHKKLEGATFQSNQCYPQTVDNLQDMLTKAGFKDIDIKQEIRNRKFDSADKLAEWMFGWAGGFPVLASLLENERKVFINDVAYCYAQIMEKHDKGQVIYMLPTLIVSASK